MEQNQALVSIVEQETQLFALSEQHEQRDEAAAFRDARLYARLTHCGIATAFLQHNLATHHNLDTERVMGEPSKAPRANFTLRAFGHVVLRHNETIIDPTYGQLFQFAGVHPHQPETSSEVYPKSLALVMNDVDFETKTEELADHLYEATKLEQAQRETYAPFREKGKVAIRDIVRNIYDMDQYEAYPYLGDVQTDDRIQSLIKVSQRVRKNS